MPALLTPKQIARAIQVSESSVKRWCDQGLIPTQYTAGGHRRVPLGGLLEFLRSTKHQLVRPEVLGLPATTGQTARVLDRAASQLTEALLQGDLEQCRQITFDLYLAEHSMATICDRVFAQAFHNIGRRWECGEAQIYEERRGCGMAQAALSELRSLLAPPPPQAPLAVGGTPTGDHYSLPTAMAELLLCDAGWSATSLGCNLPFETLAAALRQQQPRLFWLSCSHVADEPAFVQGYAALSEEFGQQVALVVGGRALTESLRQQMRYAAFCDTMQHLESFVHTLQRGVHQPADPVAAAADSAKSATG
jgi:MerR family transcriptional regulator, light-induced transcriptional regulator